MKILIVDDNEEDRYMLETLLRGHGYEVESAADGVEALEKASQDGFDLIISDILMPRMDGFQLCREVKTNEKLKNIAFVFYTATYTDPKDEEFALSLGAEKFIAKPEEPDVFIEILKEVIRSYETGTLVAPKLPVEEEPVYFKRYNERLVKKLEDKMLLLGNANKALGESERKYRELIDNANDAVIVVEPTGYFSFVNPRFCEVTGYSMEEAKKLHFSKLVHPEDLAMVTENFSKRLAGEEVPRNYEFRGLTRAGETIYVDYNSSTIQREGKIVGALGILRDIAERKRAEKALRESEDKYRTIFETTVTATVIIEEDATISLANTEFERLSGYSKEELEGKKRWTEFVVKDDLERMKEYHRMRRIDLDAAPRKYEFHFIDRQGNVRDIFLAVDLIPGTKKSVASLLDITERKRAEQKAREAEVLREADRLKSDLLANVSHELRTPLASIKGFVSTLLRTDVKWREEDQRDFLQTIDQETDRLTRLISDILDMSRLESGGLELKKGNYHISEILGSVSSRLSSLTEHHRLQVIVPSELPSVFVDEMRIGQVLANLVENATKYSPEGSEIAIEAQLAGDQVTVSVIDRGEGIASELLDRVFDRFYQAESIVTGRKSGTGLGLSICRGIIEAHGGRIWVESKLGEGSKFSFSLPVGRREDEVAESSGH